MLPTLALLALLAGCDDPVPTYSPLDPPGPGEGWVDGGGLIVPPLGALLAVSGADSDGLRVYSVALGDALDCAAQRAYDDAVEAANERWIEDGDHDALLAAIAAADRALYPAGTWKLHLDLGRRAGPTEDLPLGDVRLFGERRTDDGVDAEFTADAAGVESFEGSAARAAGVLDFGASWTGDAVDDGYFEFRVAFDAPTCP